MSAKETIEKLKKARIITALVTPFKENGQINFEAFPKLVEDLLASHTEGLIRSEERRVGKECRL